MNAIFLFSLKSAFVSGILTCWYMLALKNRKLHTYNRGYLLFTLYASIQLPLLNFNWLMVNTTSSVHISKILQVISTTGESETYYPSQVAHAAYHGPALIFILYTAISAVLLTLLVINIISVLKLKRKYPVTKTDGVNMIHTNLPNAPFSFLNNLFWRDNISLTTETGQQIYRHELAHIKQRHTIDKLLCRLATSVFWVNPFYWLIQKELNMLHEFIADEQAITGSDTDAFARMLLQSHNGGQYMISPVHHFFSSPIKRRLVMLHNIKKMHFSHATRFMVLPLVAGTIFIFSFTTHKKPATGLPRNGKKIVLVLDAGHGGNDIGAQTAAYKEKDLNLRITNRISELAAAYGITVHLTRSEDVYPSLPDRSMLSNSFQPDAFVSIHINQHAKENPFNKDYEVYVSAKNSQYTKSKALATSVAHGLSTSGIDISQLSLNEKGLYVLKNSTAPAILIECGDIQNAPEMALITDNEHLDAICNSILKGIVDFHNSN